MAFLNLELLFKLFLQSHKIANLSLPASAMQLSNECSAKEATNQELGCTTYSCDPVILSARSCGRVGSQFTTESIYLENINGQLPKKMNKQVAQTKGSM